MGANSSDGAFTHIAITYANRLADVEHENLAVANLSGARRSRQRVHHFIQPRVWNHNLDLHLRQQVNVVLLPPVSLRVPLLTAMTADFGDGHAVHPDGNESFLYVVQL